MIKKIIGLTIFFSAYTGAIYAQSTQTERTIPATDASPIQGIKTCNVGFIYPVSTNGIGAMGCTNYFSFNVLAGVSRSERGFSLAGVSNIIFDSAGGCQIAGFSNHIHGGSGGLQLAGFMNLVGKEASGVRIAGFLNKTKGASGLSLAGFANIDRGRVGDSGAAGGLRGAGEVQAAGGSQVAGFINIAGKVKGIQLAGFINIADSSDYPIALFNFIRNGEQWIGISTDETLTTLLSFRSGGRVLYGIAGLGYNHKGSRELAAWQAGLGAHWRWSSLWCLNTELVNTGLTDFKHGDYLRSSLRILPSLRLSSRIGLFAGPSLNYIYSEKGLGADLLSHYLWSEEKNGFIKHALYFGATGGIQIRI